MKIAIIVLAVILGCQAISDVEVLKKWDIFQEKFGKTYKSPLESRQRLYIFRENLNKIEAHNILYSEGKETYLLGLTQFTDWTVEEFLQYVNKYQMPFNRSEEVLESKGLPVPETIDWREKGAVREVKNQGQCGSCWTFSTTGALEGAAYLVKGQTVSLSEQNLLDCADSRYYQNGCNGGNMAWAFLYVRDHGIATESSYPYRAVQGTCQNVAAVLQGTGYKYVQASEQKLKEAVGTVGPISVGIEATANLQNYVSGVIYDKLCSNKINHGVLAVGYGSENGQEYWLVKNSWGASWGEAGFFKLARNQNNNCAIANMATYPTL